MNNRWIVCCGLTGLILCLGVAAYAFDANFDPSTYNPEIAQIVNFEVCTSCLDGGDGFTYSWDFDSDGVAEIETDQTLVTYSFASEGFYDVCLTVSDAGGRTSVMHKGIIVGSVPAVGVRDLVTESDGTIMALITITVNEEISALGIEEGLPSGWSVELVDPDGAIGMTNALEKRQEYVWSSMYEPGESVTFSYRLRPINKTTLPTLQGKVTGFVDGKYVTVSMAGALGLPQ
jgi:PKD repeat protein